MPVADGRAACRHREPRGYGRGHARQLVPEPPSTSGVGRSAATGEFFARTLTLTLTRARTLTLTRARTLALTLTLTLTLTFALTLAPTLTLTR